MCGHQILRRVRADSSPTSTSSTRRLRWRGDAGSNGRWGQQPTENGLSKNRVRHVVQGTVVQGEIQPTVVRPTSGRWRARRTGGTGRNPTGMPRMFEQSRRRRRRRELGDARRRVCGRSGGWLVADERRRPAREALEGPVAGEGRVAARARQRRDGHKKTKVLARRAAMLRVSGGRGASSTKL